MKQQRDISPFLGIEVTNHIDKTFDLQDTDPLGKSDDQQVTQLLLSSPFHQQDYDSHSKLQTQEETESLFNEHMSTHSFSPNSSFQSIFLLNEKLITDTSLSSDNKYNPWHSELAKKFANFTT